MLAEYLRIDTWYCNDIVQMACYGANAGFLIVNGKTTASQVLIVQVNFDRNYWDETLLPVFTYFFINVLAPHVAAILLNLEEKCKFLVLCSFEQWAAYIKNSELERSFFVWTIENYHDMPGTYVGQSCNVTLTLPVVVAQPILLPSNLKHLPNSCYINSVLFVLWAIFKRDTTSDGFVSL